jgi:hypothetical protein
MLALGYSNVETAKALGVHRATIGEWRKDPRFAELCRALIDEVQGLEVSFHGPLLRRAAVLTVTVLDREIERAKSGGQLADLVLLTALLRELSTAQREAAAFRFWGRPPSHVPPQHGRGEHVHDAQIEPESPPQDEEGFDLAAYTRQMARLGGSSS